jgi:hypothetical protein
LDGSFTGKIIKKTVYITPDEKGRMDDTFLIVNKTENYSDAVSDPLLGIFLIFIIQGLSPESYYREFPNFLKTLLSNHQITREVFTFDLPRNKFMFGVDDKLEKLFTYLENPASFAKSQNILNNKFSTDSSNQILENYLIVPLVSSESYSVGLENILFNDQVILESENKIAYIDSGNTLLAFPMSFLKHFKRIFNLEGKCYFRTEDNSMFKNLICEKRVVDYDLKLEINLSTENAIYGYSMEENEQNKETFSEKKNSLQFDVLDLIEDADLRKYQIDRKNERENTFNT